MKISKLFAITLQSKSGLVFLAVLSAYNLLLGVYLKDFFVLSPMLVTFYLLTVLPTLFLLTDVRSKSMRALIFTLLLLIGLIDLTYLFRCRRIFLFPTIISLVIVLIYFGAYIEEPKKRRVLDEKFRTDCYANRCSKLNLRIQIYVQSERTLS